MNSFVWKFYLLHLSYTSKVKAVSHHVSLFSCIHNNVRYLEQKHTTDTNEPRHLKSPFLNRLYRVL